MKNNVCMLKFAISILTVAVMVALSGCIKQKIVVKVKPDGSGNIVVSTIFNKDIVTAFEKQMDEQRKKLAEQGISSEHIDKALKDPFFNEKQINQAASKFGDAVEYVKSKKISNASGRGYIAIYSFKNIDDVKLDLEKLTSPMPSFGTSTPSDDSISFVFTKGDVAKLKVTIPQSEKDATIEEESSEVFEPTLLTDQEKSQMMIQGNMFGLSGKEKTKEEVLRKMFDGMSVDIDLEVVGTLVKSDATFKSAKKKGRCTLFAMDFGILLESDKFCSRMANDKGGDFLKGFMTSKTKLKGMKIEEKPEITLEFKSK